MLPSLDDNAVFESQASDADRNLVVRFTKQSQLNREASDKEGRPMYKDVDFITILVPGDKTLTIHRPVRLSGARRDDQRFPVQWQAFRNATHAAKEGTPLAGLGFVTDGQRRELEYFHVYTVEQLASISDGFASQQMGVQQLKLAAQRFLSAAKEKAPAQALAKELAERDAKIAGLEDMLQKLVAKLDANSTPAPISLPKGTKAA